MSKQKFQIGDKVTPKKDKFNSLVGKIIDIYRTAYGESRKVYKVSFTEDNSSCGRYYSYELNFADLHSLADHAEKYGLPKLTKKEMKDINPSKFEIGDLVKIPMSTFIPNVAKVTEITYNPEYDAYRYHVEFSDGMIGLYMEFELVQPSLNDEALYNHYLSVQHCNDKPSSNDAKYCKYCKELIDNEEVFESEEPGVCDICYKMKKDITPVKPRKSASIDMEHFDVFGQKGDWLEVTEWTNGEGIDIDIHYATDHDEDIRHFSLTYSQLSGIVNIVNKFGYSITIFTDSEEKENIKI